MVTQKKTVYVAMSGGVDSSVAAALLKERKLNVVGVFFKPWQPGNWSTGELGTSKRKGILEPITNYQLPITSYCDWQQDRQDAMRVAAILGIPFKTWDFSKEYGQKVARYMIDSYRQGITPNPDVMCNKEIKFGLFLKSALAEGADYIATGHYVRMQAVSNKLISNKQTKKGKRKKKNLHKNSLSFYHDRSNLIAAKMFKLLEAKDRNKDQSYFLWTLTQAQLKHCLFPIGDYTKPEVRSLARKFGLPNHDKKDSQGVCFVGEFDMKDFLTNYIKPRAGKIKLIDDGKTIGQHDGVYYYTIGQRHGLNIGNGDGPYYVVGKDLKKNIIYVAKVAQAGARQGSPLLTRVTLVKEVSWIGGKIKLPLRAKVKIRYRNEAAPAIIFKNGADHTVRVEFLKPARAVTPGQSAVIYRGREVLGGGVLT